jgi:hypothetical protein
MMRLLAYSQAGGCWHACFGSSATCQSNSALLHLHTGVPYRWKLFADSMFGLTPQNHSMLLHYVFAGW